MHEPDFQLGILQAAHEFAKLGWAIHAQVQTFLNMGDHDVRFVHEQDINWNAVERMLPALESLAEYDQDLADQLEYAKEVCERAGVDLRPSY